MSERIVWKHGVGYVIESTEKHEHVEEKRNERD